MKKSNNKAAAEAITVNRRRLLNNDAPFAMKEAYVKLRTSLMFCMTADKARPCKTFAVTSAKPSEGKSLTAANIAISYAMLGKRVLLVDADMRKPTQRRLWKVELSTGLCDYLAKIWQLELAKVTELPLWIVCTGTIPPNPSELLSSDRMKSFVESCADYYDYVIIDTPPINTVVDLCRRRRARGTLRQYDCRRAECRDCRCTPRGRESLRRRAERSEHEIREIRQQVQIRR